MLLRKRQTRTVYVGATAISAQRARAAQDSGVTDRPALQGHDSPGCVRRANNQRVQPRQWVLQGKNYIPLAADHDHRGGWNELDHVHCAFYIQRTPAEFAHQF